ncbi:MULTISPECIES: hypothetical protein [Microseira]|uniref:hypothetical protein n=1 Tax=Microseira TaxID=1609595 RepID=UPI001CFE4C30|nr:hypothetical protein [Microseira wollei]
MSAFVDVGGGKLLLVKSSTPPYRLGVRLGHALANECASRTKATERTCLTNSVRQ